MELRRLNKTEDAIHYYTLIRDIPYADGTKPEQVLAAILQGRYTLEVGYIGDKPVGIVIYYISGDIAFVVGTWVKNNMRGFPKILYSKLKNEGVRTFRSMTKHNTPAYGRLMNMKHLWSVYEYITEEEE